MKSISQIMEEIKTIKKNYRKSRYIYTVEYLDTSQTDVYKMYEFEELLHTRLQVAKVLVKDSKGLVLGEVQVYGIKTRKVKTAKLIVKEEYYCFCPYCNTMISDEINIEEEEFYPSMLITCPNCHKQFELAE